MNTQPQNKILILIIGILLIANIATLSFFLMSKPGHSRGGKYDKKAQISAYLKNEVGFSAEQLSLYDTMSKKHRVEMKHAFDAMTAPREEIFRKLGTAAFSDTALENAAASIAAQQKSFEIMMLHHLKDIRSICSPAQKPVFDTGFYKIISKRGEGRNK